MCKLLNSYRRSTSNVLTFSLLGHHSTGELSVSAAVCNPSDMLTIACLVWKVAAV